MLLCSGRLVCSRALARQTFVPKKDIPSVSSVTKEVAAYLREQKTRKYEPAEYEKSLEPRTSADSEVQFVIPLSTDTRMQSDYLSAMGHVRTGKLLEDMDVTAAYVALKHNREDRSTTGLGSGSLPRIAVTASVERLDFYKHGLHPFKDIIIEGKVSYAGRTTVETAIKVFQHEEATNNVQQILKANFIMAARCPTTQKGVRVHPLIAASTDEAAAISDAEERVKERQRSKQQSLDVTNPTHEEFCQLHQNFLLAGKKKRQTMHELTLMERQVWQHETQCSTWISCHPVHQNFYGAVFGGFLMREAQELAQLTAKIFCKGRVQSVSMDDVNFLRGIQVGSFVKITSTVAFTKDTYLQVRVLAEVVDKDTYEKNISNVFHFTFQAADGQPVKEVVPKHYEHGVLWLEGRRQLEKTLGKF